MIASVGMAGSGAATGANVNLIIVGLRRSGTTVFWRTFRRDSGFTAYDEPFNPKLVTLPEEHRKDTRKEYIDLIDQDPERFWKAFAPIPLDGELERDLGADNRSYLSYLTSGHGRVALDTTRCHFKIGDLAAEIPGSTLVHLYREPTALASSHLLPSGWRLRRRARLASRKLRFWTLSDGYDHWGFQTIIGNGPSSAFGLRMTESGMDAEKTYSIPGAGRLLALWKVFDDEAERAGIEHFGERFISLPFERFAEQPDAVLDLIYGIMQAPRPAVAMSDVKQASRGFTPGHSRWQALATEVGIGDLTPSQIRVGGRTVTVD